MKKKINAHRQLHLLTAEDRRLSPEKASSPQSQQEMDTLTANGVRRYQAGMLSAAAWRPTCLSWTYPIPSFRGSCGTATSKPLGNTTEKFCPSPRGKPCKSWIAP